MYILAAWAFHPAGEAKPLTAVLHGGAFMEGQTDRRSLAKVANTIGGRFRQLQQVANIKLITYRCATTTHIYTNKKGKYASMRKIKLIITENNN